MAPKLDTVIIQPDAKRVLMLWRASASLGRKLQALREVVIGAPPRSPRQGATNKPYFRSLAEFVEWKRQNRPPPRR